VGEQLAGDQAPIGAAGHDVGERAAPVDPEFPALLFVHEAASPARSALILFGDGDRGVVGSAGSGGGQTPPPPPPPPPRTPRAPRKPPAPAPHTPPARRRRSA